MEKNGRKKATISVLEGKRRRGDIDPKDSKSVEDAERVVEAKVWRRLSA